MGHPGISLPPQLTHAEAGAFVAQASPLVAQASVELWVDAAPLQRFDSAALSALLALRRQAQRRAVAFHLRGAPQRLWDLATLYGVEALLTS